MLSRRILRIKAFKAVYGIAENPGITMKEAEAELEKSCEATRDLYLFLLALCPSLKEEASRRIEAARSKFNPTPEEKNPNMKFVGNRIPAILSEDPDFVKLLGKKRFSWDQYDVFLRHLYDAVSSREWFHAYMDSQEDGLKQDADLFVKIFSEELEDSEELASILEDLSIWWNDDLGYSLTWCCKSLQALGEGRRWNLPPLYASELPGNETLESDHAFVVGIVRNAYRHFDEYSGAVAALTPKWDRSRICTTDLALIVAGMAEAAAFPAMPVKVIINEYVEISKFYSTPESRAFVNGLLDKLINKE